MEDELMNKLHTIIASIACVTILLSCEQNEVMDYALADKVYFNETSVVSSVETAVYEKNYSFALQNSALMTDTFEIAVQLMGNVADYDRTFSAVAVADSSTAISGTHYKLIDGVMKAGEYESYLPVILYRTEDTQEEAVNVQLQLSNDAELGAGINDAIKFTLTWGDILLEPEHWPEYYFGVYSTNKYRFAIDVLELTDWPQTARITTTPEEGVYTISEIQGFVTTLNEAYEEYREEYGPIYVDDDAEILEEIYYGSN